jgi:hypothetical protein
VALSGDGNLLVGGASFGDVVYVYERAMTEWTQQAEIIPPVYGHLDFGGAVALTNDGAILAIGASYANVGVANSGAVYVYERAATNEWISQARLSAANPGTFDLFGSSIALSADGQVMAVGAMGEASDATGIDGDSTNDAAPAAGAVYVFRRDAVSGWSEEAYVKASNAEAGDTFGTSVALSDDGTLMAIGAAGEDSGALGLGGDQTDDSADNNTGAVYVYQREANAWVQRTYVKASNAWAGQDFGVGLALAGDGNTLAVGADGGAAYLY